MTQQSWTFFFQIIFLSHDCSALTTTTSILYALESFDTISAISIKLNLTLTLCCWDIWPPTHKNRMKIMFANPCWAETDLLLTDAENYKMNCGWTRVSWSIAFEWSCSQVHRPYIPQLLKTDISHNPALINDFKKVWYADLASLLGNININPSGRDTGAAIVYNFMENNKLEENLNPHNEAWCIAPMLKHTIHVLHKQYMCLLVSMYFSTFWTYRSIKNDLSPFCTSCNHSSSLQPQTAKPDSSDPESFLKHFQASVVECKANFSVFWELLF